MRLNCDLGEGFGQWQSATDELAMPHIDMANIACGFHASDPLTMSRTVALAVEHNVAIGAHPGYPDLVGFGRRSMAMDKDELVNCIIYQVGALNAIAKTHGTRVTYVKPHGAMYNDMMSQSAVFHAVIEACSSLELPLMLLAGKACEDYNPIIESANVEVIREGFCDRRYTVTGELVARTKSHGVITLGSEIIEQAAQLAQGYVITEAGTRMELKVDTLCVHGDNPSAVEQIKAIRQVLLEGVQS